MAGSALSFDDLPSASDTTKPMTFDDLPAAAPGPDLRSTGQQLYDSFYNAYAKQPVEEYRGALEGLGNAMRAKPEDYRLGPGLNELAQAGDVAMQALNVPVAPFAGVAKELGEALIPGGTADPTSDSVRDRLKWSVGQSAEIAPYFAPIPGLQAVRAERAAAQPVKALERIAEGKPALAPEASPPRPASASEAAGPLPAEQAPATPAGYPEPFQRKPSPASVQAPEVISFDDLPDAPATARPVPSAVAEVAAPKAAPAALSFDDIPAAKPGSIEPDLAPYAEDIRAARAPLRAEPSLFDAIRDLGGIKPDPDTAALLKGYRGEPFKKRVLNPGGLSPDAMRAALQERGWFGGMESQYGPNATEVGRYPGDDIQDLYDLIDREARGTKVYPPESPMHEYLAHRQLLDEDLGQAGIGAADDIPTAARKLQAYRQSATADQAALDAERQIDTDMRGSLTDEDWRSLQEEHNYEPVPEYEPGVDLGAEYEAAPSVEDYGREAGPLGESEGNLARRGEEASGTDRAAQDVGRGAEEIPRELNVEPGAEGIPQTIIPGAEQSARQLAAAREAVGHGRKAVRAEQREPGGMFEPPPDTSQRTMFQVGRAQAPKPFYSALTRGIEGISQKKASPQQWSGIIDNLRSKGIKQEEIDWSGVKDWLQSKTGSVTKDEVSAFLRENEVNVQEVMHGGKEADRQIALERADRALRDHLVKNEHFDENGARDYAIDAVNGNLSPGQLRMETPQARELTQNLVEAYERRQTGDYEARTKFGQYVLPGGPLSRDTEILTLDGWKRMDAVAIGDVVLTRKDVGGNLEWQIVEAVPTVFAPWLYHFHNQSIDMMVTKNHQMVVKRRRRSKSGIFRVTAERLWNMSEVVVPLTGAWNGRGTKKLFGLDAGDVAELVGWYLSEGSACRTRKGTKSTLSIAQSKDFNPEKCRRLEALFDRLGIRWNYVATGPAYFLAIRTIPRALVDLLHEQGTSYHKFVPSMFFTQSKTVIARLLEAMLLGDGCLTRAKGRKPKWNYFSASKRLADDVQVLALLDGKRASVRTRTTGLHVVSICAKEWASVDDAKAGKVEYNDTAYCVTVKNHAIYVRRNGVAAFTGNSNYRELLLTLPARDRITREPSKAPAGWGDTEGGNQGFIERGNTGADFRGSHWAEPNVLAHVRFDDRAGPNGERVLHISEIQSDWHQKGRKQGYKQNNTALPDGWSVKDNSAGNKQLFDPQGNRVGTTFDSEADAIAFLNDRGVPDAPFKSSWHELAAKRMLRYAVENGYDRLSWDTGATNAARYDLSKHLDSIGYEKRGETYNIAAYGKGRDAVWRNDHATLKDIEDHLGKEMAEKIAGGVGRAEGKLKYLEDLDLKVGGEGMAGFYDKILPQYLNKYAKKWGAKVDGGEIATSNPSGEPGYLKGRVPAHSISITPAMRESVMQGQPLFQKGEGAASLAPGERVKLADDLIARMPDKPTPQEAALIDEVGKIAQRIVPTAKVYPARALESVEYGKTQVGKGRRIFGAQTVNGTRRIIAWSLESPDAAGTMRHEAVHYLHQSGFLNGNEWTTLSHSAEKNGWIEKHGIDKRYADLDKAGQIEESVAEEYAAWANGQSKVGPITKQAFVKIKNLLGKVAGHVRKAFGKDATAEDVFRRIESGEVGKRAEGMEPGADTSLYAQREKRNLDVKASIEAAKAAIKAGKSRDAVMARLRERGVDPVGLFEGEGEVKTSALGLGVDALAIKNKLTDTIGDLPEYRVANMEEQARKATNFVKSDYDGAKIVALGRGDAPAGVLPESVFNAVEREATIRGDVDTIRDLAEKSNLVTEATRMGQRIRTLGERDPTSPVGAIQAISKAKQEGIKSHFPDAQKAKAKVVSEIKSEIKRARPKRPSWDSFIQEITCGY